MGRLHLAIFASGRGSNFKAILDAIRSGRLDAEVRVLITNNPGAGAIQIAESHGIPVAVISKSAFPNREAFVGTLLSTLQEHGVDLIALAGYMKKLPAEVIQAYRNRIVNIHPALLPAFGGKGMYGLRVHEAVLAAGCRVSGATVHLVDEMYDHGPIVAQRAVPVEETDTPETLAERVLAVEHVLYPETLQLFAEDRVRVHGGRVSIRPASSHQKDGRLS